MWAWFGVFVEATLTWLKNLFKMKTPRQARFVMFCAGTQLLTEITDFEFVMISADLLRWPSESFEKNGKMSHLL